MEWEDEATWLRHRVMRMRTILRFTDSARVEAGLESLSPRPNNGWSCYKSGGRGQGRRRAP
jgi:hypothetical protein